MRWPCSASGMSPRADRAAVGPARQAHGPRSAGGRRRARASPGVHRAEDDARGLSRRRGDDLPEPLRGLRRAAAGGDGVRLSGGGVPATGRFGRYARARCSSWTPNRSSRSPTRSTGSSPTPICGSDYARPARSARPVSDGATPRASTPPSTSAPANSRGDVGRRARRAASPRFASSPGYTRFWCAATLARLANEMAAVGVVLYVLDRTGSAAWAGATLAAITLPSIITGPLLGAWLDRGGRRLEAIRHRSGRLGASLAAIAALAGRRRTTSAARRAARGADVPALDGRVLQPDPLLCRGDLRVPANALEASSYNTAIVAGPGDRGRARDRDHAARRGTGPDRPEAGRTSPRPQLRPREPLPSRRASRSGASRSRGSGCSSRPARCSRPPRPGRCHSSVGASCRLAFPFFAVEELGEPAGVRRLAVGRFRRRVADSAAWGRSESRRAAARTRSSFGRPARPARDAALAARVEPRHRARC